MLKNGLLRRTLDNVTVVLIAFSNFKHAAFGPSDEKSVSKVQTSSSTQNQQHKPKIHNISHNEQRRIKENIPPPLTTTNA